MSNRRKNDALLKAAFEDHFSDLLHFFFLVIFTGKPGKQTPSEHRTCLLNTELVFRFRTYHVFNHTKDELIAMNSAFALIVLAIQYQLLASDMTEEHLGREKMHLIRLFLEREAKPYSYEHISRTLHFLHKFLPI